MQKNCIIAGVGGQGILSIAAILDYAAMQCGLHVKQAEVHGMSQRGGAVEAHVRLSDSEIFSDLIPQGKAECIIAMEPMEALRYIPFLEKNGKIITAIKPVKNCNNYPEEQTIIDELQKTTVTICLDVEKIALECGSSKVTNVIILGAASPYLGISHDAYITAIKTIFAGKGADVVAMNIAAFNKGVEFSK